MKLYYLHKKDDNCPKNEDGFDYLISTKIEKFTTSIKIENIEYCYHEAKGTVIKWDYDDCIMEVLGNLNVIKATFKKVIIGNDYDENDFELWKNINIKP